MSGVNKVILVGNLGNKPELKTLPSGQTVCKFSLATNESWTDKQGQKQERTEWHRIKVWGKVGENCAKYLDKGRQVYIEGKIQTRTVEGDGGKKYYTDIVAHQVQFLGGRDGGAGTAPAQSSNQSAPAPDDDPLPF